MGKEAESMIKQAIATQLEVDGYPCRNDDGSISESVMKPALSYINRHTDIPLHLSIDKATLALEKVMDEVDAQIRHWLKEDDLPVDEDLIKSDKFWCLDHEETFDDLKDAAASVYEIHKDAVRDRYYTDEKNLILEEEDPEYF